ncbi:MAG TPA: hypothetical protein VLG67_00820 [Candidatus Saccharimonadales bacterium]|nr:hypothetical protein [Candidatus Saccharimonadales bacterium]
MEISILSKSSIRIKGKSSVLSVDPTQKTECNAVILLANETSGVKINDEDVVFNGPGEYEAGGVKITGYRVESDLAFSINIDSINLTLGKLSTLSKFQNKLKEANILVVNCNELIDASFLTSMASSVIIFYGEKAAEVGKAIGAENVKNLSKYATTIDKLPAEVETVILE